jgi:hypothetical protein
VFLKAVLQQRERHLPWHTRMSRRASRKSRSVGKRLHRSGTRSLHQSFSNTGEILFTALGSLVNTNTGQQSQAASPSSSGDVVASVLSLLRGVLQLVWIVALSVLVLAIRIVWGVYLMVWKLVLRPLDHCLRKARRKTKRCRRRNCLCLNSPGVALFRNSGYFLLFNVFVVLVFALVGVWFLAIARHSTIPIRGRFGMQQMSISDRISILCTHSRGTLVEQQIYFIHLLRRSGFGD